MDNIDIGRRIKEVFSTNAINQTELQPIVGLPRSAITEWCKGKARPSMDSLLKICDYFQVSMDWLLFGDECEKYVRNPMENYDWMNRHCSNPVIRSTISSIKGGAVQKPDDVSTDDPVINAYLLLSDLDKIRVASYIDGISGKTVPTNSASVSEPQDSSSVVLDRVLM